MEELSDEDPRLSWFFLILLSPGASFCRALFFFFSSRRRHTRCSRDWSSDVCSSDLWSYRNEGAFHEAVTNRILDDLVGALKPRRCEVTGDFFVRGGIHTVVVARHPD